MLKTERQLSSGGVVYKKVNDRVQVVLISVKGRRVWCLPKGLVEKGEGIVNTALREVKEETGLDGKILTEIDTVSYWYARREEGNTTRYFKRVHFFLMEYTGGDVKDHDWEVEDVKWFPIEEAIEVAEYESEKEILKKAGEMMKK